MGAWKSGYGLALMDETSGGMGEYDVRSLGIEVIACAICQLVHAYVEVGGAWEWASDGVGFEEGVVLVGFDVTGDNMAR